MDYHEIAERIQQLADLNNISVNKALIDCGSKNFITNIKNGSAPSADKILKIAEYFNVTTDWLLTGEGSMYKDGIEAEVPEGKIVFTVHPYGGGMEVHTISLEDWKIAEPLIDRLFQQKEKERKNSKKKK